MKVSRQPNDKLAMQVFRTPDARFDALPDFDYQPSYVEVGDDDGGALRMAYVAAGPPDGPVTVLLHGEPTSSYLYRSVIPLLVDAGFRVVAPDMVGFGRSDKLADTADHTFARHIEWMRSLLFDTLDSQAVNLVEHDWGGAIGLGLAAGQPERFAVVLSNTGMPPGHTEMPQEWWEYRHSIETIGELNIFRVGA